MKIIFNEKIKKLRLEKGYSKKFVAKQIKVSYSTYLRYEKGITLPKVTQLYNICKFYNISSTDFYEK